MDRNGKEGTAMAQWDDNKIKVKDIFDAIRNFGLTGVVFYAGVHNLIHTSEYHYLNYLLCMNGSLLILLSLYLFFINVRSFYRTVQEEHSAGNVSTFFFNIVPALILMLGISLLFSSATLIVLDSGKTIGDTKINEFIRAE